MHSINVAVIGGDLRQLSAARRLLGLGHRVSVLGIDPSFIGAAPEGLRVGTNWQSEVGAADCLLLPLPYSVDGVRVGAPLGKGEINLRELLAKSVRCRLILGGRLREEFLSVAREQGIRAVDYAALDSFAQRNALPTAEGALEIALRELPVTIAGARILLCGWGRVAKALADVLQPLGASIWVAARRIEAREAIESAGMHAISFLEIPETARNAYDLVFNTVPARVIDREAMEALGDIPMVELASLPGGFDVDAAEALGRNVILAPGLPGKTAPVSAGRILADCASEVIEEVFG